MSSRGENLEASNTRASAYSLAVPTSHSTSHNSKMVLPTVNLGPLKCTRTDGISLSQSWMILPWLFAFPPKDLGEIVSYGCPSPSHVEAHLK